MIFSCFNCIESQELMTITTLDSSITESSGMIILSGRLITHNDSGGESRLYEIDSVTGTVTRSVFVENAFNVDWEDICYDSNYIYIGDIGNNAGTRTDLKIYRLSIVDYLLNTNDTVSVDTINFSYADQTDFSPNTFSTNFDAEALISYNDSLYIFTKNWGNNWTNVYSIPKVPGTHIIYKRDSINTQGLISGAVFNDSNDEIMLSGYTFSGPFIVQLSGFNSAKFSEGIVNRQSLNYPSGTSYQIESIYHSVNNYYITSEEYTLGQAALFSLNLDLSKIIEHKINGVHFYPNPAIDYIQIDVENHHSSELYTPGGILVLKSINHYLNVAKISRGLYVLISKDTEGRILFSSTLILQ